MKKQNLLFRKRFKQDHQRLIKIVDKHYDKICALAKVLRKDLAEWVTVKTQYGSISFQPDWNGVFTWKMNYKRKKKA